MFDPGEHAVRHTAIEYKLTLIDSYKDLETTGK